MGTIEQLEDMANKRDDDARAAELEAARRLLHPNGRCECCGEGECAWCKRSEREIRALGVWPKCLRVEAGEMLRNLREHEADLRALLDGHRKFFNFEHAAASRYEFEASAIVCVRTIAKWACDGEGP